MSDIAISVKNLGKQYQLGQREAYKSLAETITNTLVNPFRKMSVPHKDVTYSHPDKFWALKDVTFDISRGEVTGIIGGNGAGKSTLLKILSRITTPTEGIATVHGRIGSLLEVGTGFHPELTGRENIYLSGSILGMRKQEISQKFDEIVRFSELEQFIDTPVKRYSSGMYVRLAFSVAAHLETEILLIDEVLAVGDAVFQKKCISNMNKVSREGRTILFVSHNISAVESLCDTGIVITAGKACEKKEISEAIFDYSRQISSMDRLTFPVSNEDLSIEKFEITQHQFPMTEFDGGEPIDIRIDFETLKDLSSFRIGIFIKTVTGEMISRILLDDWSGSYMFMKKGRYSAKCSLPANLLVAGDYYIQMHGSRFGKVDYLLENHISYLIHVKQPVGFNPSYLGERAFGLIYVNPQWELFELDENGS